MLELMNKGLRGNGIFALHKSVSSQMLLTIKKKDSDITAEKPSRHHLLQGIEINITGNGIHNVCAP